MAMTKKKVLDYVMTTPYNTNRTILEGMLDELMVSDNAVLKTITIPPTTSDQTVEPDDCDGYSAVTVSGVTAAIDENITAGNIKSGVTILGVEGTYTPTDENLLPENIKSGVTIFGVEGTYTGE